MRNDLFVGKIFDKFSEVTSDISDCDVERFLKLDEPVTVGDLLCREEVLELGHLSKSVRVSHSWVGKHAGN